MTVSAEVWADTREIRLFILESVGDHYSFECLHFRIVDRK